MDTQKKMKMRLVTALIMMVALGAGFGTGCTTTVDPEKRAAIRAEVADVMRFAYEVGGRAAYSNYVERMVADGKLTPERAAQLHVISQEVFDRLVDKLDKRNTSQTQRLPGVCRKNRQQAPAPILALRDPGRRYAGRFVDRLTDRDERHPTRHR